MGHDVRPPSTSTELSLKFASRHGSSPGPGGTWGHWWYSNRLWRIRALPIRRITGTGMTLDRDRSHPVPSSYLVDGAILLGVPPVPLVPRQGTQPNNANFDLGKRGVTSPPAIRT